MVSGNIFWLNIVHCFYYYDDALYSPLSHKVKMDGLPSLDSLE